MPCTDGASSALTCIVEHDVGPEVLKSLVQRCLCSIQVLDVICACNQQYASSLDCKQRLGAISRAVMCMVAPEMAAPAINLHDATLLSILQMDTRLHYRVGNISRCPL